jgi:hypothetical protein
MGVDRIVVGSFCVLAQIESMKILDVVSAAHQCRREWDRQSRRISNKVLRRMRGALARGLAFAVLLGVLAIRSDAPSAQSTQPATQAPAATLSLQANVWKTIGDPDPFPLDNDAAGNLRFEFPVTGSINYLYNVGPPKAIAGRLSVSIQITTSGPVMFNFMTEPSNTCATAASVRPFFWAHGNSQDEFDRWWSNPMALTLAAGSKTFRVPLTSENWSSVFGKFGNASAAAQAGFKSALENVSRLGLTFGGGCFFGHGVNVRGGSARFALLAYRIE